MGSYVTNWTQPANRRWIRPYIWPFNVATVANTNAGRVRLELTEVSETQIVDGVCVFNFATVAGNITVGVYGPITTEETPVGSPVAIESASTPMAGANSPQVITFTPTVLPPGRYYVCAEYSDVNATYGQATANQILNTPGTLCYYDRAGGYGALTNPCPAVTALTSPPVLTLRVYKP